MGKASIQLGYVIMFTAQIIWVLSLFLPWAQKKMISVSGAETMMVYLTSIRVESDFSLTSKFTSYMTAMGFTPMIPCGHAHCWKISVMSAAQKAQVADQMGPLGLIGQGIVSGRGQMTAAAYGGIGMGLSPSSTSGFLLTVGNIGLTSMCMLFLCYYSRERASQKTRVWANRFVKMAAGSSFMTVALYTGALAVLSKRPPELLSASSSAAPLPGYIMSVCAFFTIVAAAIASSYWKSDTSEFLVAKEKMRQNMDIMVMTDSDDDYDDDDEENGDDDAW